MPFAKLKETTVVFKLSEHGATSAAQAGTDRPMGSGHSLHDNEPTRESTTSFCATVTKLSVNSNNVRKEVVAQH